MIATILIFLLIFFVIVMGHEFGHFLLAKANGIRVNEFAIGMGPKIAHFQKGETDYVLRALPIGGACMFEGEDGLESENGRTQEGNFQNAAVWARISTVVAGPAFNFLLAFVFAIIVAGYAGADLPVLGGVSEGSAAEAAGPKRGAALRPPPPEARARGHAGPEVVEGEEAAALPLLLPGRSGGRRQEAAERRIRPRCPGGNRQISGRAGIRSVPFFL